MTSIRLIVEGTTARAEVTGELIAGMAGIPVTIQCDSTWEGLSKDLVCRSGEGAGELSACTRMIPDVKDAATVAHEVMVGGRPLYLGLEGYNADGTVVYPTKWADCGMILAGTEVGADPSLAPTLPVWRWVRTLLDQVPETIRTALTQAKESGEFNGLNGANGRDGADGKDGANGRDGIDGKDGVNGRDGADGKDGADGRDGYSPVKYVDYWTEADQEAIVQQVIAALGTPVFGTVDADKNIILSGVLTDGTYTLKYEDAEGNLITIGTIQAEGAPKYTNILPMAINADGSAYNGGQGWKSGYRLNSSGVEASLAGWEVTGFIPIDVSMDVLYFKNVQWQSSSPGNDYVGLYDANFVQLTSTKLISEWFAGDANRVSMWGFSRDEDGNVTKINFPKWSGAGFGSLTSATWPNVKYVRFSMYDINENSVITRNEPIE